MRINNFVFDKTLLNTMFVSLGIHIFYFSCIVFTFEDKISYPMETPSIDFLGSVLRRSDVLVDGQASKGSLIMNLSDKFLSTPRQKSNAEFSYASVKKPSFVRAGMSIGQKLSTKFTGVSSSYRIEKKTAVENIGVSDSAPEWGSNLRLKADDKD